MPSLNPIRPAIKHWLSNIRNFSRLIVNRPLRQYQLRPADAILDSILHHRGETFAVMMSRQAGKNELSAQLEAYLLNLYRRSGGTIVKGSPTFKPQTINSILRLTDRLSNVWNANEYRRREGYIVELGRSRAFFFSAEPSSNVVGATASLMLEADEAQDIAAEKWDKDFTPMGASTNVTTVFYGTAWTSNTFLAQSIAFLEQLQAKDGLQRVFRVTADEVAEEVPQYGDFVKTQVARLGRNHPLIRTQFYLEPIDGTGGLFPPARRALMRGNHERRRAPDLGHRYAILVDVAGEDEAEGDALDRVMLANPRRDATAITVVDVVVDGGTGGSTVRTPAATGSTVGAPAATGSTVGTPAATDGTVRTAAATGYAVRTPAATEGAVRTPAATEGAVWTPQRIGRRLYRVVDRRLYLGTRHTLLHGSILALARLWHAAWVVVDATGVGAGLASFLVAALGEDRVIPVQFAPAVKSDLGWDFVGIVETGRYQDYVEDGEPETRQFWYEVEACQYEIGTGPAKRMRWGCWEAPAYDGLVARGHDDLLISASLVAVVDKLALPGGAVGEVVVTPDALDDIDGATW